MAGLTSTTIAGSYERLLILPAGGLNGTTLVATTDGDTDTTSALSVATTSIAVGATNKIRLDGSSSGDTYIYESGADVLDFYVGGANMLKLTESTLDTIAMIGNATLTHTVTTAASTPIGLLIDSNTSGDAAQNSVGLHVDFDRTVATGSTNAHNDIGIDLDVNSRSLGTSSVIGMDIDVVGHADGTSTATGLTVTVGSADTNYAALFTGGHIGVGTTTPDLAAYGSNQTVLSVVNESSAGNYGAIEIAGHRTNDGGVGDLNIIHTDGSDTVQARSIIRGLRDGANDAIAMAFFTEATGASTTEKMRITSAGNVGIGTSSNVDELLHLQSATSGKPVLKIENTNTLNF